MKLEKKILFQKYKLVAKLNAKKNSSDVRI